jgi:hypothetical protein
MSECGLLEADHIEIQWNILRIRQAKDAKIRQGLSGYLSDKEIDAILGPRPRRPYSQQKGVVINA